MYKNVPRKRLLFAYHFTLLYIFSRKVKTKLHSNKADNKHALVNYSTIKNFIDGSGEFCSNRENRLNLIQSRTCFGSECLLIIRRLESTLRLTTMASRRFKLKSSFMFLKDWGRSACLNNKFLPMSKYSNIDLVLLKL